MRNLLLAGKLSTHSCNNNLKMPVNKIFGIKFENSGTYMLFSWEII